MSSIFASKIDEMFQISDDAAARLLLHDLGLLGKFQDGTTLSEPWLSMVVELFHNSHFVVGIRFTGMASAADNGYLVDCIPKSRFTEKQALDFMNRQYGNSGIPGTWVSGHEPRSNSQN